MDLEGERFGLIGKNRSLLKRNIINHCGKRIFNGVIMMQLNVDLWRNRGSVLIGRGLHSAVHLISGTCCDLLDIVDQQ